jgi:predicted lipase
VGKQYGFDGAGRYSHAGMLKVALAIYAELEANEVLSRIFSPDSTLQTPLREVSQWTTKYLHSIEPLFLLYERCHILFTKQKSSYAHYRMVVTGHSLGAGSAVLLSLLLRKNFPTLQCYAFGTPGSVLDKRSAKGTSCLYVFDHRNIT